MLTVSRAVTRQLSSSTASTNVAALVSCTFSSSSFRCSVTALSMARREYHYPYAEEFVPRGAKTSRFQSSGVPSQRIKVLQEYAFSPLFGARDCLCMIGSPLSVKHVIDRKQSLRSALADLLELDEEDIVLGQAVALKHLLLHKPQDPISYRYDRRVGGKGTLLARTLVPVFLREDVAAELGDECCKELAELALVAVNSGEVAALQELGFTYAEAEKLDETTPTFSQVCGKTMSEADIISVGERWDARHDVNAAS